MYKSLDICITKLFMREVHFADQKFTELVPLNSGQISDIFITAEKLSIWRAVPFIVGDLHDFCIYNQCDNAS